VKELNRVDLGSLDHCLSQKGKADQQQQNKWD
jgi:hypothetical protein